MSMLRSRNSGGRLVRSRSAPKRTAPRKMRRGGKFLTAAPGGSSVYQTGIKANVQDDPPGCKWYCADGSVSYCDECPCDCKIGTKPTN